MNKKELRKFVKESRDSGIAGEETARLLNEQGVLFPLTKTPWTAEKVSRFARNEKLGRKKVHYTKGKKTTPEKTSNYIFNKTTTKLEPIAGASADNLPLFLEASVTPRRWPKTEQRRVDFALKVLNSNLDPYLKLDIVKSYLTN